MKLRGTYQNVSLSDEKVRALHKIPMNVHIFYENMPEGDFFMEKITENSSAHLAGRVLQGPAFNHKTYGQAYYMVVLGIFRKSGYEDRIRLIISEQILGGRSPRAGEFLEISGQIRTYNREQNGRSRLEVTVFVRSMTYMSEENFRYENYIFLEGFICKKPVRRTSPLGREICDLMIAVNRQYNKSDYIPAIAWGRNASYCGILDVGDKILLEGRIQSREYRKYTDEGMLETRTAYEVSAVRVEK